MNTQVIPLGQSGKQVVLTRDGALTRATVMLDGKEHGLAFVIPEGCPVERVRAAEERLVRAGAKSLMIYELLGTLDPAEWPGRIKERHPGPDDYYLACKQWEAKHPWSTHLS